MIQMAQDDVSLFFEDKAFITRDLLVVGQESANYSRRCVNDCDLVVLIVGNEYGQVNQSGVSQPHLTYTNAKAKNKPMLIFVSHDPSNLRSRHLVDLINSIQSSPATLQPHIHTVHFNAQQGLKQALPLAFESLGLTKHRWCDCHDKTHKKESVEPKALSEPLEGELLDGILLTQKVDLNLPLLLTLDDEVSLDCTAHVFEGGTLIEVEFVFTLTYQRILQTLSELKSPFSEQGFSRCLNDLIDKHKVDDMIRSQHPKAHAISRHQIKKLELTRVKSDLQLAEWLVSMNNGLWSVSEDVKRVLHVGGGG